MSVSPRSDSPYQVSVVDVVGVLDQFGFVAPVLVGVGVGCVTAVLVAAWYPDRVGRLILIDPSLEGGGLVGQSLRDCRPDMAGLRAGLTCPVLETSALDAFEKFLLS